MLDRRDDTLGLHPLDRAGGDERAEQRILRDVLEVAPVTDVPSQIDPASQDNIEPADAALPTEQPTSLTSQPRVETRPQAQPARKRGRGVTRTVAGIGDPQARVTHPQRRHPQPRDARGVPGTQRTLIIGDPRVAHRSQRVRPHHTDHHGQPLVVGHLPLDGCRLVLRGPRHLTRLHGHSTLPSEHPERESLAAIAHNHNPPEHRDPPLNACVRRGLTITARYRHALRPAPTASRPPRRPLTLGGDWR